MTLAALILLILIWVGFGVYKQYSLWDFNIQEASKTGRIINIRGHWYNIHFVNKYPILLMSDDQGKTWHEKNMRGIWNVFPMFEFLKLDNPIVDVISKEKTIYIVSKQQYMSWDDSTGFFFRYKSNNEGKNWSSCTTSDTEYYGRSNYAHEPYCYYTYDNEVKARHNLEQDYSEVVQAE